MTEGTPISYASRPAPTPQRPEGSPPRRPGNGRRRQRARGVATLVALGIVGLIGGTVWSTLKHLGGKGPGSATPTEIVKLASNPAYDREQFPGKNRVNVLLIGMDYSYLWTTHNKSLNGARYTKNSRADSIMMLSIDMDTHKVSALSVPRDTKITAPDGHTGKINGTYSRGGAKLLIQSITDLLGVAPDYYIAVKPDAVRDMVNVLGGVNVSTKDAMEYNDSAAHLHIQLPAGEQEINGDQAVGFARFREADRYERNPDGSPIYTGEKDSQGNPIFRQRHSIVHSKEEGDPNRMARQQQLIRAMAAKAKSPENWLKITNIVDTAYSELDTNLQTKQALALMFYFHELQPDQIQSASLEGKGTTGGVYFFIPDERKKEAMVDWLLKGDETAADRLTVVAVENGTAIRGAAARVADKLRKDGFDARSSTLPPTAVAADTAAGATPAPTTPVGVAATRVVYGKASVATRAQRIAQLLGVPLTQVAKLPPPPAATAPVAALKPKGHHAVSTASDADVTVILGQDLAASYAQQSALR